MIQAATVSFDADLILTYGHQGMLFKGYLDCGCTVVVIKQFTITTQRRKYESFSNDILHSKINHLHVLLVMGFCCDDVHQLYLVSKYMCNGSLDHHLNKDSRNFLSWNLRLQFCIGVAKGLDYLYRGMVSRTL